MKIGIIREGKVPPDSRVPLTPQQCKTLQEQVNIVVQHSPKRCYSDQEYEKAGVTLVPDVADCDVSIGTSLTPIKT
ncbi:MAG: alanine dehydrogenase, partial [Bacteroidota bacterium]